jgi:hypothetical protein
MIRKLSNYLFRTTLIMAPFALMVMLSSCQKIDCVGCYDDAPWSAPGQTVCYPDQETCEDQLGVKCYKCD